MQEIEYYGKVGHNRIAHLCKDGSELVHFGTEEIRKKHSELAASYLEFKELRVIGIIHENGKIKNIQFIPFKK